MFWQQKHHSHFWFYLLGLTGAFLLGRECERWRKIHSGHFAHWKDKMWDNPHHQKGNEKPEEVPSPS